MPRKPRRNNNEDDNNEDDENQERERIAQITAQRLAFLILFLLFVILVLIFKIGDVWWFDWMIEYRKRIIGLMLFVEIFLLLWSPVIVETDTNPRPLTGPGKDPRRPWDP